MTTVAHRFLGTLLVLLTAAPAIAQQRIPIRPPVAQAKEGGGGHGTGNGGDGEVEEFTRLGRRVHRYLVSRPPGALPLIDPDKFLAAIEETEISSVDEVLYLNGVPKDAINYPREHKLVLSRPRWASLPDVLRLTTATHELLWLAGVPDAKYKATFDLLEGSGLLPGGALVAAQSAIAPGEIKRWTRDARTTLESGIHQAYLSRTDREARDLMVRAIQGTIDGGPVGLTKFMVSTLHAALADQDIFGDDLAGRVRTLTTNAQFSIQDLDLFDVGRNATENGAYIRRTLERALSFGRLARKDVEEFNLLQRAAQRGIALFDVSEFSRLPGHACSYKLLKDAIGAADDDALPLKSRLQLLRGLLKDAAPLRRGC